MPRIRVSKSCKVSGRLIACTLAQKLAALLQEFQHFRTCRAAARAATFEAQLVEPSLSPIYGFRDERFHLITNPVVQPTSSSHHVHCSGQSVASPLLAGASLVLEGIDERLILLLGVEIPTDFRRLIHWIYPAGHR